MVRAPCCEKMGLKKGPWTPEEDQTLVNYIRLHGHNNWRALPKHAGLLRCGKSCRLRWTNYLRPDIKRGNFSQDEEETIIKLHQLLGNRWSAIAAKLPGRTDNEIKNVWHTHLKKRLPPHVNNPTNCGSTSTTPVSGAATAINVAASPTRKRSRKASMSKGNVVPKKRASTHERSMETSGNDDVIAAIEIAMPTSSIKIEPVSPQPCTSDVSTLTSTSTNTENNGNGVENDSNRGTSTNRENIVIKVENDPCLDENMGINQNDIGDLPDINDDFWMEVLSVEDTAISTEGMPSMSQSEGNILGTDPVFETEYSNVNYEDMDVFWHNLLTESHELPEIIEIL